MENQNAQQSSELSSSQPTRSRRRMEQIALTNVSLWLIWSGVWTLLLAIATLSVFSLTHPLEVTEQTETFPKAEKQVQTAQVNRKIPTWLMGSVGLIVVAGALVIAKRLHDSSRATRVLTRRQQRQQLLEGQTASLSELEQLLSTVAPKASDRPQEEASTNLHQINYLNSEPESLLSLLEESQPVTASEVLEEVTTLPVKESQPVTVSESLAEVTVLPPEPNQPATVSESLADLMDIRKQRSLSSLLQDTLESAED